jgi:hypothetical protein
LRRWRPYRRHQTAARKVRLFGGYRGDEAMKPSGSGSFIVRDANGHALAYVYFEDDPAGEAFDFQRRSSAWPC